MIKLETQDIKSSGTGATPQPQKKPRLEKMIQSFEWFSNKLGQQRHLSALKDALMFIMPLIIVGAVAVLFVTIIFGGWNSEKASLLGLIWMAAHHSTEVVFTGAWKEISDFGTNIFASVKSVGIDTMALFISFFIGYFIGKSRNTPIPLYSAIIGLGSFLIMTKFNWNYIDAKGVFPAILVSLLASEIFCWLEKQKRLKIKMPDAIPTMVGAAFSVLIPFMIVLSTFGLIEAIIIIASHLSSYDLHEIKTQMFSAKDMASAGVNLIPNTKVNQADILALLNNSSISIADNLKDKVEGIWSSGGLLKVNYQVVSVEANSMSFAALLYHFLTLPILHFAGGNGGLGLGILHQFLAAFFFFFGIHGSNITSGIFDPIWLQTHAENVAAVQVGATPPYIFTQAFFWIFANIGGTGSTLSLIIVVLLFSKNRSHIEVSKFALPAGIFQVNEPVTFGFPIVANPILAIPFILSPVFTVVIAWLFIGPLGLVDKPTVLMPWTMPNIIGAPLVTRDWKAVFITISQFVITFALYLPAVLIDNKINGDKNMGSSFVRFRDWTKQRSANKKSLKEAK